MSTNLSTDAAQAMAVGPSPAAAWSGKAIVGFAFALIAVLIPAPFGLAAAVFAIVAAVLSRRDLQRRPELRGATVSALAFVLGAGVLLAGFLIPGLAIVPLLLVMFL